MLALICSFISCSATPLQSLSVKDFEQKLQQTSTPQLVDVRTPQEYAEAHLVAAVNIDVKAGNFREEIEKLDKARPVFVYCRSGARSKTAANILLKAGFKEVYDLDKGINAWREAGKPVEK